MKKEKKKRKKSVHSAGAPEEGGRRALCWKLLLNYLPLDTNQWDETLRKKRAQYQHFVGEYEGH